LLAVVAYRQRMGAKFARALLVDRVLLCAYIETLRPPA